MLFRSHLRQAHRPDIVTHKMFSGSSSYLGGNAGRPTGQQPFNPYGQGQQQQAGTFAGQQPGLQPPGAFPMSAQPTGFQQPQQTGYQQQALQQQYTGFPAQSQYGQQGQQQGFQPPPMPPIPAQHQQQHQQQQQSKQQAPVQPQPTGFSQMAASFQNLGTGSKAKGRRAAKPPSKIPNIRLSFITAKDQAQFETLFKSAAGDDQALSGDKSRDILLRSNLDGESLSQIWYALL